MPARFKTFKKWSTWILIIMKKMNNDLGSKLGLWIKLVILEKFYFKKIEAIKRVDVTPTGVAWNTQPTLPASFYRKAQRITNQQPTPQLSKSSLAPFYTQKRKTQNTKPNPKLPDSLSLSLTNSPSSTFTDSSDGGGFNISSIPTLRPVLGSPPHFSKTRPLPLQLSVLIPTC